MTKQEWEEYNGKYEKKFYDIKLENGFIVKHCWPNAGKFHDGEGQRYSSEWPGQLRITHYRVSEEQ